MATEVGDRTSVTGALAFGLSRCFLFLVLFKPLVATNSASGFNLDECETVLGMQNEAIEESALSASSSIDSKKRGPASARIRTEHGDGAWCPRQPIAADTYEYLEVDLRQLKVVTMVETQGRFGNGQGTEYTDQYRLEYQREDGGRWFRFKNRRGQEIIQGNSNTYIAEMREIHPAIVARRIRFVPVSVHPRTVCLRVELYGCPWTNGVVSYEMPQGHRYSPDLDLIDLSYDGEQASDVLRGGLGQLTDGDEGQTNFQLPSTDLGSRSSQWIGWRNESLSGLPVSIIFRFDATRNFSFAYIRCNNMFPKSVRVFRMARVFFGAGSASGGWNGGGEFAGGGEFDRQPAVRYTYARDDQAVYARTVKIPLGHGIGRFVKLELYLDDRWMMISEVHFESVYVHPSLVQEELDVGDHVTFSSDHVIGNAGDSRGLFASPTSSQRNDVIEGNDWTANIHLPYGTPRTVPSPMATAVAGVMKKPPGIRNGLEYGSVVAMIVVLAVLLLVLCSVLVLIFCRRHKLVCFSGPCSAKKSSSAMLTNQPSTTSISRPSSLLYPSSYLIHSTSSYRPPCPTVPSSYSISNHHHHHHDDPFHSTASDLLISPTVTSPYATIDLPVDHTSQEVQSDEDDDDRSWSPGGVYSTPASLQLLPNLSEHVPLTTIHRNCLKFSRTLGEGRFGQVYICEVLDQTTNPYGRFVSSLVVDHSTDQPGSTVAVKVLQHNAPELKRSQFEREVRKMLRLQDPNIAEMLTFFMDEEPFCIILEYPRFGDLKTFLRERRSAEASDHDGTVPGCELLSYGCLIFIASQIASGMKYFEGCGLVHRDLAARNCLVGDHFSIKISDLGTSHIQHPQDYSTSAGQVLLPIRWMSWESILLGSFTIKSDIWSFGVTVWEILTMAERLPFDALADDEVVENCHNIYCESPAGKVQRLEQPPRCPKEIYDLLCHCWTKDECQRPSFQEIHMFLQKKNVGYRPENERTTNTMRTKNNSCHRPYFV